MIINTKKISIKETKDYYKISNPTKNSIKNSSILNPKKNNLNKKKNNNLISIPI